MRMFYLRLKGGDIISRINATTREIAISYFSELKRLKKKGPAGNIPDYRVELRKRAFPF